MEKLRKPQSVLTWETTRGSFDQEKEDIMRYVSNFLVEKTEVGLLLILIHTFLEEID